MHYWSVIFVFLWTKIKLRSTKVKKKRENKAKYLPILTNQVWSILYLSRSLSRKPSFCRTKTGEGKIYPSWPPGYPTRTRELLNIASYRTSNIIILSAVSFSEAVSEPFSIARSEPSNEQEDAYDIVQAMQEVQLQAHAAPSRPVDTSGWVTTVI